MYSAVDMHLNGAGIDFVFARTYSQLVRYAGPLGFNWDHSYNLWLRIDDDGVSLHRSTGALVEQLFTRHEQFGYWVPPDGVSAILLEEGGSFVFRQPDGVRVAYRPHPTLQPSIHVVDTIADRFGNRLAFFYDEGLLARVEINHSDRIIAFSYDGEQRIGEIRDFSGRVWRYDYDAVGDLVAVTRPATAQHRAGATTEYEYAGSLHADPVLEHGLTSVLDADGRLYLENEYGTAQGLLSHGRVVAQRQGGGDVMFDYADVIEDFSIAYEEHERPTRQTIVTERDGRQARYLFNRLGNMVFKEEYARLDGVPKLVSSHYRYNRDGNLIGMVSPLGVITQAMYGRDLYERRSPVPQGDRPRPETDPNLTADARLTFHNLLAVVRRGAYHDVTSLGLAGGLWSNTIFPDILDIADSDAVQKFSYEGEFAQLLSASDPRATRSADPDFVEDPEHERRLTRYSYAAGLGHQRLFLDTVDLPTPTLPDGTPGEAVRTTFASYDDRGRVVEIVAPNGLRSVNEYFGAADGLLEGFLRGTTLDPGGLDVQQRVDRDPLGRVVRLMRPQFFDAGDGRFASTSTYNELSQVVESTGTAPFSITTRNTYTRGGALMRSEVDLKNRDNALVGTGATRNRYDEELNLVAQEIGDDAATKRTKTVFDRASRPSLHISPSGRRKKISFNERSLIGKVVQDHGGIHAVTRGFYDADGRLVRVVDPRGGVTRYVYDALGRLIDTEDAEGNRIIRHFDKIGNLLVECLFEHRDDGFVLLHRREFSYDELGRTILAGANRFGPQAPLAAGGSGRPSGRRDRATC